MDIHSSPPNHENGNGQASASLASQVDPDSRKPRSSTTPSPTQLRYIQIPRRFEMSDQRPVAGPSSEGALSLRRNDEDRPPTPPTSPSSAPAFPSVIALAHPSPYIHTHHPRRGSQTPLGLHVISPVPPQPHASPVRSIGFSPSLPTPIDPAEAEARRGSAASTCSTLTQSRPSWAGHPSHPSNSGHERRRSSLTPSFPSISRASPTRTHVAGRTSRPGSREGGAGSSSNSRSRVQSTDSEGGRRGSMPQLHFAGWNGPQSRQWNPSLTPQRGSLTEDATAFPDEGFKFGSGGPSSATAALKNLEVSPSTRRSSVSSRKKAGDAFEELEAKEAERQRRAFLAATYGEDGKRARERLSFASASSGTAGAPAPTPQGSLRRQSLALWERIHGVRPLEPVSVSAFGATTEPTPLPAEDTVAIRRGSLPVAIPGRSPTRDDEELGASPTETDVIGGQAAPNQLAADSQETLRVPLRPLPPLLPLSDPGPRLLPSTLALHRANHLLNSRNLQADPLPHPLPPSLHPPAPVDLAEFDIDFILAGSQAQLGGDSTAANAPVDIASPSTHPSSIVMPPYKLGGGDEEDTFAKFVGAFDDEYGDRRGEWTFRACPQLSVPQSPFAEPLSFGDIPLEQWDCSGAGRYELYPDGDVRSVQTGGIWHVRKISSREYLLTQKRRSSSVVPAPPLETPPVLPMTIVPTDRYVLASKATHRDHGGVKIASAGPSASASQHVSILEAPIVDRNARGSVASDATIQPPTRQHIPQSGLSQSLPSGGPATPKKKRQMSKGDKDSQPPSFVQRGRSSISAASGRTFSSDGRKKEKGAEDEEKKKGGLGGAIKRVIKNTINAQEEKRAQREERERERAQASSWSPGALRPREVVHPSGKTFAEKAGSSGSSTPFAEFRRSIGSRRPSVSSRDQPDPHTIEPRRQDSDTHLHALREAKAWLGVPDESIVMIVPVEDDVPSLSFPVKQGRRALLISYVPFNSGDGDRPPTATSSGSRGPPTAPSSGSSRERETLPLESSTPSPAAPAPIHVARPTPQAVNISSVNTGSALRSPTESGTSGSLPKFQKLLRRRASKDKDALRQREAERAEKEKEREASAVQAPVVPTVPPPLETSSVENKLFCHSSPLPFGAFRVVARMVDMDDLREDHVDSHSVKSGSRNSHSRSAGGVGLDLGPVISVGSQSTTSSHLAPHFSDNDEVETSSQSTAQTSTILSGRTFPTVVAVCHSRKQGVEFVLEGLDRLGFCQGESAWGPTGYEEWRGSGLSEKGRELVDILWAGCVGVMGLIA